MREIWKISKAPPISMILFLREKFIREKQNNAIHAKVSPPLSISKFLNNKQEWKIQEKKNASDLYLMGPNPAMARKKKSEKKINRAHHHDGRKRNTSNQKIPRACSSACCCGKTPLSV